MEIKYFQVDAFTNKPFRGNPAGVCLLDKVIPDEFMQKIAAQLNLSETAFLTLSDHNLKLRWFTPKVEISLCGHATLAMAHILWQNGLLDNSEIADFDTLSGVLEVKKRGEWIEMKFPAFESRPAEVPEEMLEILGVKPTYSAEVFDRYMLELSTENEVRNINPDFSRLRKFKKVLVTSAATAGSAFDFISRYFAPSIGVDEDPVTGTSHCCLAPFWSKKLNKKDLVGYQASKRGGIVKVTCQDNNVLLAGQAITVLKGSLTIPLC